MLFYDNESVALLMSMGVTIFFMLTV